jgi:hypothetical protein
MPLTLTLSDIAPSLAKRMQEYIAHHKDQIEYAPAYRHSTGEILREERKAILGFTRVRNLSGGVGGVLSSIGGLAMGLEPVTTLALGGVLGAGVATTFHLAYQPRMKAHYAARLFSESLKAVVTTKTEKAYVEILIDVNKLPKDVQKTLLAPLNTLLDTHIMLSLWEKDLLAINTNPESLKQEGISLLQKAKNATDPTTRDAFLQSAKLIDERLDILPQMEAISLRLQAQQELIYQTLLSQQMALRRGKVTTQSVQMPDTTRLNETATSLHRQSQAIEDAMQELITLQ